MKILITGALGLIGSEAVKFYQGHEIVGVDNNSRSKWFGTEKRRIEQEGYTHSYADIRSYEQVESVFKTYGPFDYIIHAAAQPSHDLAAQIPIEDFEVNARGTLNLLEATRQHSPEAVFIQLSTNKVYGDLPNSIPVRRLGKRYVVPLAYQDGIDE